MREWAGHERKGQPSSHQKQKSIETGNTMTLVLQASRSSKIWHAMQVLQIGIQMGEY
jgi:hypothetical protein